MRALEHTVEASITNGMLLNAGYGGNAPIYEITVVVAE